MQICAINDLQRPKRIRPRSVNVLSRCTIRTVSFRRYTLQDPRILLAGDEGPDQPAQMRRQIWVFVARICDDPFSHIPNQFII